MMRDYKEVDIYIRDKTPLEREGRTKILAEFKEKPKILITKLMEPKLYNDTQRKLSTMIPKVASPILAGVTRKYYLLHNYCS